MHLGKPRAEARGFNLRQTKKPGETLSHFANAPGHPQCLSQHLSRFRCRAPGLKTLVEFAGHAKRDRTEQVG
jgi:hypothetical protein